VVRWGLNSVRSATDGDVAVPQRLFAEFYTAQYSPMVRLAHLVTGSNQAAEDLVQDAFLRLGPRWHRVDQPAAYLRRIVVNRCLTWRGRAAVRTGPDRSLTASTHLHHRPR